MHLTTLRRKTGWIWAPAILLSLACGLPAAADEPEGGGSVYVMTNQSAGNTVVVFHRDASGLLAKVQEVSTQGLGTGSGGDSLGSQGSLTLADEGRVLLAVNAGSNEISLLAVTPDGLHFVSKAASGGVKPVSVAVRGDVAYVLNAGGTPNVTSLRIGISGQLTIIGSMPLPGGASAAPAQVGISPDGEVLVVTEKSTNQIDLFPIDDGQMAAGSTVPSDGATPFGFVFGRQQKLVVTEAASSTISSYMVGSVENHPTLQTITKSLPDSGAASCWIAIDRSRRIAFVVNSGTATISSLAVSPDGELQLLVPAAANTGAGTAPIDLALTRSGRFLYVLSTTKGTLTGFRVENGTLSQVTSESGLPLSIQGIAAR